MNKRLTTIPRGSRAKRLETRRVSQEIVIWSDLHGDMQRASAGKSLRTLLNTLSADWFIGVPVNIASYAMLLEMVACTLSLEARHLTLSFGDHHIYLNHMDAVEEQLSRTPGPVPEIHVNPEKQGRGLDGLLSMDWSDIRLQDYHPQGKIEAKVAV